MKRLTPFEKVNNFINKCYDLEIDKWNAGLNNNMMEWEEFVLDFNRIDEVADLRKDNSELRFYNEKLKNENERLWKIINEMRNKYES